MNTVVYYHRDADGIASAYAARKRAVLGSEFRSIQYGERVSADSIKELGASKVEFYDFFPEVEDVVALMDKGIRVAIHDHHIGAKLRLEALAVVVCANVETRDGSLYVGSDEITRIGRGSLSAILDLRKWGCAESVWDEKSPPERINPAIYHISRRDVWDFSNDLTKPFCEFLNLVLDVEQPFQCFQTLAEFDFNCADQAEIEKSMEAAIAVGVALVTKMERDVEGVLKKKHNLVIYKEGKMALVCNACNSNVLQSEIGNAIVKRCAGVAAVYHIAENNELRISFRTGEDWSGRAREYAETLGGGGHDNAAGATIKDYIIEREGSTTLVIRVK